MAPEVQICLQCDPQAIEIAQLCSQSFFFFLIFNFFGVTCPIWLSLLFSLVFLPSSGPSFPSSYFGEAGIRTHVQGGSDHESSAFTTRPGGFLYSFSSLFIPDVAA